MELGELISKLQAIRDSIKDRDANKVPVVVMNCRARANEPIIEKRISVKLEAFERFPEPPDPEHPEWYKEVRIVLPGWFNVSG